MSVSAFKRAWHFVSGFWPHGPLAVLVLLGGLANLLAGLWAEGIQAVPEFRDDLGVLSTQTLLSTLGGGAQVVLGGSLMLVGLGLLWRLRAAWSFAILLLAITITVNVARDTYGTSLVLVSLVFVGLLLTRSAFTRITLLGSSIASLMTIAIVMAYGMFGAYLIGAGFDPPIDDLTTGLYFTVVTLSTVGYGDINPITAEAKLFVISLIVVGLSVFATAVLSILGPALANRLSTFFSPEKHMYLNDHIILVGQGAIARNTARELNRRDELLVQVLAVGEDPELPDRPVVHGDSSEDAVLEEARITTARMVVAAMDDDDDNAFIALAAKDLNPEVRVVAVASSPRAIRRLKRAGADVVFSPAAVGSRLLAGLIEGEGIPDEYLDLLRDGEA